LIRSTFWLAVATLVMAPAFASATTVTIVSGRDNTIYRNNVNNSNGKGVQMLTGNTGIAAPNTEPRRGLIWFDIDSNIPDGATINSASLRLHLASNSTSGPANTTVNMYRLLEDWGEGTSAAGTGSGTGAGVSATTNDATWNMAKFNTVAWSTPGGVFSSTVSASLSVSKLGVNPADPYTTDFKTWAAAQLAADIQLWLDNTAPNYGWILSPVVSPQDTAVNTERRFNTREAPDLPAGAGFPQTSVVPVLTVDFTEAAAVPEPGTWALALTGLALLTLMFKRHANRMGALR
jgi:hypothetical protein